MHVTHVEMLVHGLFHGHALHGSQKYNKHQHLQTRTWEATWVLEKMSGSLTTRLIHGLKKCALRLPAAKLGCPNKSSWPH